MMALKSRINFNPPSLGVPAFLSNILPHERFSLINLGCARNLVDSEIILGQMKSAHARIVPLEQADTVIVNTCAFIIDAKQETIDTLINLIDLKRAKKIKKIIALGCFTKRYAVIVKKEFPEIDEIYGTLSLDQDQNFPRDLLTPPWSAYVKICESCYNHCSFCAIPAIKGRFSSRRITPIVEEIKTLEGRGAKEINLIGQDITAYGFDLGGSANLTALLKKIIAQTHKIHWIRLLYAFPKHVTDDLLDLMASEERICQYLDVPLQHISNRILTSMNRKFTQLQTVKLVEKIRKRIPQCSLRTAFIVGYPGETDKEFKELCQFVKDIEFDHVGVFSYSKEEGTRAAQIKNQISGRIKHERYNKLMKIQQPLSAKRLKRFVGKNLEVLIEEQKEENVFIGRSAYDAPEVDGVVYVQTKNRLKPGNFIQVKVVDSLEYDLCAQYEVRNDEFSQ